ncbi:MAG: SMR family transporter [Roseibium album]|uniref:Methyl viologen resistance protein C n=1 Tax=Roseibium album TaxID=311410 RepID=A0A0M7AVY2_9HYPH|nr:SMR family transporter [Roseibium album]MBG6147975.1 small multidrug resistance pump [Labrenzia sp. EL_142]MBG6154519.1 small multidrug resistance pump [Labrenzia sp. EL_162]MBG6161796.1 small multidrug resistance pump [Labrenzia sp. EL_195]MBG6176451.1 small multidrug resistance pump [Labrenzia sp. EL_132]MBG6193351.1 small multidrug resistance pump [Labrenzia sp. EL_159]MBG6231080.1 small multidrug resistance pump [Labrenzia sp. EL_208]
MPASPIATYLFLGAAILAEVIATSALARTENFTRLVPSLITIAGYGLSFWLLSYPIRVLPTGVVYAIWSGAGIVLITMVAWLAFDQKLDLPALVGLGLIIAGVVIINVFSKSVAH